MPLLTALAAAALQPAAAAANPVPLAQVTAVLPYRTTEESGCRLDARAGTTRFAFATSLRTDWRPEVSLIVHGARLAGRSGRFPVVVAPTFTVEGTSSPSRLRSAAEVLPGGALRIEIGAALLGPVKATFKGKSYDLSYDRLTVTADSATLLDARIGADFHAALKQLGACSARQPPFDPAQPTPPPLPQDRPAPPSPATIAGLGARLDTAIRAVPTSFFLVDARPSPLADVRTSGCRTLFRTAAGATTIDWSRRDAEPAHGVTQLIALRTPSGALAALRANVPGQSDLEQGAGNRYVPQFRAISAAMASLWQACARI